MWSHSPRDTVVASMFVVVAMSFAVGVFSMGAAERYTRHDPSYGWTLMLIPLFIVAVLVSVRRILRAVP
jgi:hypothetical protein